MNIATTLFTFESGKAHFFEKRDRSFTWQEIGVGQIKIEINQTATGQLNYSITFEFPDEKLFIGSANFGPQGEIINIPMIVQRNQDPRIWNVYSRLSNGSYEKSSSRSFKFYYGQYGEKFRHVLNKSKYKLMEYLNGSRGKTAAVGSLFPVISPHEVWNDKKPKAEFMEAGDFDFVFESPESSSSTSSSSKMGSMNNFMYKSPDAFTFDPRYPLSYPSPSFDNATGHKNQMFSTLPPPPPPLAPSFSHYPSSSLKLDMNNNNSNNNNNFNNDTFGSSFDQMGCWDNSLFCGSSSSKSSKKNSGHSNSREKTSTTANSAPGYSPFPSYHNPKTSSSSPSSLASPFIYSPGQSSIFKDFESSPSTSSSSPFQLGSVFSESAFQSTSNSFFSAEAMAEHHRKREFNSLGGQESDVFKTNKSITDRFSPVIIKPTTMPEVKLDGTSTFEDQRPSSSSSSNYETTELKSKFFPHIKIDASKLKAEEGTSDNKEGCERKLKKILRQTIYINLDNDGVSCKPDGTNEGDNSVVRRNKSTRHVSFSSVPQITEFTRSESELMSMIGVDQDIEDTENDFDDNNLLLDCSCEMQVEVRNDADESVKPRSTIQEGTLRIYLNRKNCISWVTFKGGKNNFVFSSPILSDLLRIFYRTNLATKQIVWLGMAPKCEEGTTLDSLDIAKFFMHRYTAKFPKTRIFVHATNVFMECTLAAEKSNISFTKLLKLTNQESVLSDQCPASFQQLFS